MRLVSGGPVHRTVTSRPPPNKVTFRNQFEPDMDLVTYLRRTTVTDAAMNKYNAEECLKRAAECTHQAEAASDPELKLYLMKLALSWTQAAAGETVERKHEDA